MEFSPKQILIYGVGLMGGSISLAIQKKYPDCLVTGLVANEFEKLQVSSKKICHEVFLETEFPISERHSQFDLIIFSLPVSLIPQKIASIPLEFSGILTSLGSTMKASMEQAKTLGLTNFVCSHPMCGSEESGPLSANPNLYEKKLILLSFEKSFLESHQKNITEFWKKLESIPNTIEYRYHDKIMAYLSHSPHILSSLMTIWANGEESVQKENLSSAIPIVGGGFKDMVRIAGSNPNMWGAIVSENHENIVESLKKFSGLLSEFVENLEKANAQEKKELVQNLFTNSKKSRQNLLKIRELE